MLAEVPLTHSPHSPRTARRKVWRAVPITRREADDEASISYSSVSKLRESRGTAHAASCALQMPVPTCPACAAQLIRRREDRKATQGHAHPFQRRSCRGEAARSARLWMVESVGICTQSSWITGAAAVAAFATRAQRAPHRGGPSAGRVHSESLRDKGQPTPDQVHEEGVETPQTGAQSSQEGGEQPSNLADFDRVLSISLSSCCPPL